MQGRRGHQGPHRGQGSSRVALGDCGAMRSVVACESRLTHIHTHPPTHTGMAPGERAPTLHTEADLYMLPPSFRRATSDPALQQLYIFPYIFSCVHMRQTGLSGFTTALCSSNLDCLLLLLGT